MIQPPNETPDTIQDVDRGDVDIAVIGAGIAGLVCAEQLRQAGYRVVVIEKSRGFGGRAATKRVPNFRADHGLRYLERSGRLLPVLIDALCDRDLLQPWNVRFCRVTPDGTLTPDLSPNPEPSAAISPQASPPSLNPIRGIIGISDAETPERTQVTANLVNPDQPSCQRYIAPAGANAIGKFLAQNLTVWRSRRAIGLLAVGDRWQVQLEAVAEGVDAPLSLTARAVVVAIPAPQALELIAATETIAPEIQATIAAVSYHPCLSVMAGYPAELAAADRGWDALQFTDDRALFWAGVESTKRKADQLCLTVHAAPEFARAQFDAPDLNACGQTLLDRLASHFPALAAHRPDFLVVHRWRYALIDRPFDRDCLSTRSPLPLVFGGDWCGTAQAETALRSGLAMAAEVTRSVDGRSLPTLDGMLTALGDGS
ncbi:MAG: FAD-dependent oxidoreductase [Oscillatoriales cyanobacterium]|nr:MAG: FAD-dependent oxidoreductase [Oscillatoriales cyanobacterium]